MFTVELKYSIYTYSIPHYKYFLYERLSKNKFLLNFDGATKFM